MKKPMFLFPLFVYSTHKRLQYEVGLDGNVCSAHRQAALTAVTDVIKESVCLIIVCCFFTVGSVKFWNYLFCDFSWGGTDRV